ncbi:MAG: hypothetical protein ACLT9S_01145 [Faecalibacterium sp.]
MASRFGRRIAEAEAMSAKAVCRKISEILITIMSESDLRCFEEMEHDAEQENYDQKRFITLASKVVVNTLVTCIVTCSKQNLQKLSTDNKLNENTRLSFFREHTGDEDDIKNAIAFDVYSDANNKKTMDTPGKVWRERFELRSTIRLKWSG